jgi:hypothetical protein
MILLPLYRINYQDGFPKIPSTGYRCIDILSIQNRVIDVMAFTRYALDINKNTVVLVVNVIYEFNQMKFIFIRWLGEGMGRVESWRSG